MRTRQALEVQASNYDPSNKCEISNEEQDFRGVLNSNNALLILSLSVFKGLRGLPFDIVENPLSYTRYEVCVYDDFLLIFWANIKNSKNNLLQIGNNNIVPFLFN